MAWLLDTNAWIHYLKNPGSRIRAGLGMRRVFAAAFLAPCRCGMPL